MSTLVIAVKHETNPPGEVYVTNDGGTAWNQLPIHVLEDRGKPSMVGALGGNVLIYGKGEGIHRSSDLGKTWTEVSKVNPLTRIPVLFKGVHYLGTAKGLLVSKDQGSSWQAQGSPVDIWQGPFFGRDQKEMLVVGESGIHQSNDAGETWRRVADLKPNTDGFKFTADWFGCYAWDPVNEIVYASSMGNPVFKLALGK